MSEMTEGYELPLIIAGAKVGLGPLEHGLLPLYTRWMNDIEVTHTLGVLRPFTLESEQAWYERVIHSAGDMHFTVYELTTGRPVGTTSLMEINYRSSTATFGIMIGERDCWNKGYGSEAARLVLEYGFFLLNLNNIMLTVHANNPRGVRAYEKAGFKIIGRRREAYRMAGEVYDVIMMDALAADFREDSIIRARLLGA